MPMTGAGYQRGQGKGWEMQLGRWTGPRPSGVQQALIRSLGVYYGLVGKSLEDFELRMNVIRLMFHQDLSAHWLEKHIEEKDVSRMTSHEIFCVKNQVRGMGGLCEDGSNGDGESGWILYIL